MTDNGHRVEIRLFFIDVVYPIALLILIVNYLKKNRLYVCSRFAVFFPLKLTRIEVFKATFPCSFSYNHRLPLRRVWIWWVSPLFGGEWTKDSMKRKQIRSMRREKGTVMSRRIERGCAFDVPVVASVSQPRRDRSLGSVRGAKGLVFMSGEFMSDA